MEIIKPGVLPGTPPPTPVRDGTCCECKCEFRFVAADVKTEQRRGLGGRHFEFYVNCPYCSVQINVPSYYRHG
jgi:hypothetical protein